MKTKKTIGIITILVIIGSLILISCEDSGGAFPAKTLEIDNTVTELGITGTSVKSSNEKIATAAIESGKIVVTSAGKGTAAITVIGPNDKSDAEIAIRVEDDGEITQGRVIKGGESVIRLSGNFGGVFKDGKECPVRLRVQFKYSSILIDSIKAGNWSLKLLPFEEELRLSFIAEVNFLDVNVSDTVEFDYNYQYSNLFNGKEIYVKDKDIANIDLHKVDIITSKHITLKGTIETTLAGTWNRNKKFTYVSVNNNSLKTDAASEMEAGWASSSVYVKNGNWQLTVPSFENEIDASFCVSLVGSDTSNEWNYLNEWEAGNRNNIKSIKIKNTSVNNIDLGTIPFVMVSGNTFTGSNAPFMYNLDFGYYWDNDQTVHINGWTGMSTSFYKGDTRSTWSVPMPANTKLDVSLTYSNNPMFINKNRFLETITTTTSAMTLILNYE